MRSRLLALATLTAYVGLAILQTWPLVQHLATDLPGLGLGDNVSFVWNLWWMREALASPTWSFFSTPMAFAPLGVPLVLHTHTAAPAWIAATLLSPLSLVTAQNVLLIGSLALNGWSVWLLARAVTADATASFLAGAMFLMSPVIAGRLMGHYNLVMVWPLVCACLAWYRWWREPRWISGLTLGLAAGVLPWFDYYLAVYFLVFAFASVVSSVLSLEIQRTQQPNRAPAIGAALVALAALGLAVAIALADRDAFVVAGLRISARSPTNALTVAWIAGLGAWLVRWRWAPAIRLGAVRDWSAIRRSAALPLIVAMLWTSPLAAPAWRLWTSGGYVTQQSGFRSGPRGVDVATTMMSPPFHGLAGPRARDLYRRFDIDPIESAAYVGWVPLLLAAAAWRQRRGDPAMREWRLVLTVFAIWALGSYLIVLGHNTGLILPGALLRVLPVVNNARIPGRALIVVAMCLSLLSAFSIRAVQPRRRTLVCGLILTAVAVESLAAPLPLAPLPPPGIYSRVAADGSDVGVLPVPFGIRDGFGERGQVIPDAIFQQTRHRHPVAGGFVARLPPGIGAWYGSHEPFAMLLRASAGEDVEPVVSCEAVRQELESDRIGFVVLYAEASPSLRRLVATLPLDHVDTDGQRELFRVSRCPGT